MGVRDGLIHLWTDTSYGYGVTRTNWISREEFDRQRDSRCSSMAEWPSHDPGVNALGNPWWHSCACVDADPGVFFVKCGGDSHAALAICSRCPVRHECLDESFVHERAANQCAGVRGGLSAQARSRRWRTYRGETRGLVTIADLHALSDETAAKIRARAQVAPSSSGATTTASTTSM